MVINLTSPVNGYDRRHRRHRRHRRADQATVVSYDDQPDQCTLHPVQPDERCRTTEWITADENSYVTLAQWR